MSDKKTCIIEIADIEHTWERRSADRIYVAYIS